MTHLPTPRPAAELSGEQYAGRACCYCATPLMHGAVSAGISRGRSGAHVLDVEVWACPSCTAAGGAYQSKETS